MSVSDGEYLYAGVVNSATWGIPAGLFALKMGFDNPSTKQKALVCLTSAACFALIGSTTHYALSRIYQNQPDDKTSPSLFHRFTRVLTSVLTTPFIVATFSTLSVQTTRHARLKTLAILKQSALPKPLIILAISTLAIHILYSTIYSGGDKSTPILSKKTFARLSTSALLSGSAVFFATCFNVI